ncbi:MAG: DinB family protein [Anaerolineae bacterium]|nr:DinB family protein [Anaerolineae bacterium]
MNLTERQAKIENIRQFPAALEAVLKSLPADKLDAHCGGSEEWTVRQVVHHVADAHINGFTRMKLIASENLPILKPYNQEAWAAQADNSLPIESSLEILRGLHARWAVFLAGLPEESWKRNGVHLENGLVSLENLLNIYVKHGEAHIEQIGKAA